MKMTVNQAFDMIEKVWRSGLIRNRDKTFQIIGDPGMGKTEQAAARGAQLFGKENVVLFYPQGMDRADFMGIPAIVNDSAKFIQLEMMRIITTATVPTLIILDDFPQIPLDIQIQFMQVLQTRMIGGHPVSDHVIFLATANEAGTNGTQEQIHALLGRMTPIEVYLPSDEWLEWGYRNFRDPYTLAIVKRDPSTYFPRTNGKFAWEDSDEASGHNMLDDLRPSGRQLYRLAKKIEAIREDRDSSGRRTTSEGELINYVHYLAKGTLGTYAGTKFATMYEVVRELPTMAQIVRDPENCPIPTNPDAQFLLGSSIMQRMTVKNAAEVTKYYHRLPGEAKQVGMEAFVKREDYYDLTDKMDRKVSNALVEQNQDIIETMNYEVS